MALTLRFTALLVGICLVLGCELADVEHREQATDPNTEESRDAASSSPSSSSASDEINLSEVVWLDANVSSWNQTATLNAGLSGGTIRLDYDKASVWPNAKTKASNGESLVGNCWVFVNLDGTWYAATWDWMRPGQTSKSKSAVRGTGGHIRQAPLNTWTPRAGETYGFMVSTPARSSERTINERSNVTMVTWQ